MSLVGEGGWNVREILEPASGGELGHPPLIPRCGTLGSFLGGKGQPPRGAQWRGSRVGVGRATWQPARGVDLQTKDAVYTLSAMTSGIRRNWIEALRKTVRPTSAPDVTKYVPSWPGTLREAPSPASLRGRHTAEGPAVAPGPPFLRRQNGEGARSILGAHPKILGGFEV